MSTKFAVVVIKAYQVFSEIKHQIFRSQLGFTSYCKHSPSCSQYCLEQVQLHGTIVGLWRGFIRILHCR